MRINLRVLSKSKNKIRSVGEKSFKKNKRECSSSTENSKRATVNSKRKDNHWRISKESYRSMKAGTSSSRNNLIKSWSKSWTRWKKKKKPWSDNTTIREAIWKIKLISWPLSSNSSSSKFRSSRHSMKKRRYLSTHNYALSKNRKKLYKK